MTKKEKDTIINNGNESVSLLFPKVNASLKGKLLIWITPIIIMGLSSLSFVAYSSIRDVTETELSTSMLASVGKIVESIKRWLATIMIEPETIASTPAAKQINLELITLTAKI